MFKKGAMFGLDARIALAIFGALSVISGAALYSAIQDSKITSELSEFRELEKAIEAYYLDNGELPRVSSLYNLQTLDLTVKQSGMNTWRGPYFDVTESILYRYGSVGIGYFKDAEWGSYSDRECKQSTSQCYVYLMVDDYPNTEALDLKVDGVAGIFTGKIRESGTNTWTFYKTDIPFDPKSSPNV
jgi:type II secretory pathway pseudopilin PulG